MQSSLNPRTHYSPVAVFFLLTLLRLCLFCFLCLLISYFHTRTRVCARDIGSKRGKTFTRASSFIGRRTGSTRRLLFHLAGSASNKTTNDSTPSFRKSTHFFDDPGAQLFPLIDYSNIIDLTVTVGFAFRWFPNDRDHQTAELIMEELGVIVIRRLNHTRCDQIRALHRLRVAHRRTAALDHSQRWRAVDYRCRSPARACA